MAVLLRFLFFPLWELPISAAAPFSEQTHTSDESCPFFLLCLWTKKQKKLCCGGAHTVILSTWELRLEDVCQFQTKLAQTLSPPKYLLNTHRFSEGDLMMEVFLFWAYGILSRKPCLKLVIFCFILSEHRDFYLQGKGSPTDIFCALTLLNSSLI